MKGDTAVAREADTLTPLSRRELALLAQLEQGRHVVQAALVQGVRHKYRVQRRQLRQTRRAIEARRHEQTLEQIMASFGRLAGVTG